MHVWLISQTSAFFFVKSLEILHFKSSFFTTSRDVSLLQETFLCVKRSFNTSREVYLLQQNFLYFTRSFFAPGKAFILYEKLNSRTLEFYQFKNVALYLKLFGFLRRFFFTSAEVSLLQEKLYHFTSSLFASEIVFFCLRRSFYTSRVVYFTFELINEICKKENRLFLCKKNFFTVNIGGFWLFT